MDRLKSIRYRRASSRDHEGVSRVKATGRILIGRHGLNFQFKQKSYGQPALSEYKWPSSSENSYRLSKWVVQSWHPQAPLDQIKIILSAQRGTRLPSGLRVSSACLSRLRRSAGSTRSRWHLLYTYTPSHCPKRLTG